MKKRLRFRSRKKKVSFLKVRFFWYSVAILFLLTSLFYLVVFSPFLKVQKIEVQGTNEIVPQHVLSVAQSNLWQKFLGIPQNSILLFDAKDLEEKLSFAFPAILHVSLKRSFPETLVVVIQEREQVGTWCPLDRMGEDTCFAIDRNGVPFKKVNEESEYVVFSSREELILGAELLDPSLLSLLLDFKESFFKLEESFQFSITSFSLGEKGEVEGVTHDGWKVLLDVKEDMEWQQTKLQVVMEQKIPLERRGELEYIDIRFGDQAYIKYAD